MIIQITQSNTNGTRPLVVQDQEQGKPVRVKVQAACVRRLKNQCIAWIRIDKLTACILLIFSFFLVRLPIPSQASDLCRSMLPNMLDRHPAVSAAGQQRQAASPSSNSTAVLTWSRRMRISAASWASMLCMFDSALLQHFRGQST
jgi:hypothetical protein